jgi:hypothetical protein
MNEKGEKKTYVLDDNDPLYSKYKSLNISELSSQLPEDFQQFIKSDTAKAFKNKNYNSLNDMEKAINNLGEYKYLAGLFNKHLDLANLIKNDLKERKIANVIEIENSILRKNVINAIYYSHKFVRKINGTSSVSLRDLQRFRRAYKFFNDYYKYKVEYLINKNEKISDKFKIKSKVESFVLSLFITYYIKIFKPRNKMFYLEAINDFVTNLAYKFTINEWYEDDNWQKESFNTIVRNEQDFLLKEMEVEKVKGIGLNNSLKENIFLMFFSIYSYIPLIVVGKPGCSKSLSIQLINRFMRGELSDSNFLKNFPTINNTSFQGSENNTPESIENIFNEAEKKNRFNSNKNA